MKKKSLLDNRILYPVLVLGLVAFALLGLVAVKQYIGYAASLDARAGYITSIIVDQRQCTEVWGGYYGMAVMVYNYSATNNGFPTDCLAQQKHLLFSCMSRSDNEVYASIKGEDDIEWDNVVAATVEDVDAYLNYTGSERDSANKTFTTTASIMLGTRSITAPATYTKQFENTNAITPYNELILKDSTDGGLIFATTTARLGTKGLNNEDANYQLILPMPNNTSPRYYFYADPYEECPAGWGYDIVGEGNVYGNAYDNITGAMLEGVMVYISSVSATTDTSGFYNMTVPYDYQYIIAVKEGYETHVGTVNVSIGVSTLYNISMVPEVPYPQNGTIHGRVIDNSTQLVLPNATVSIYGQLSLTNATGEYSFEVIEGTHNIAAIKELYNNYLEAVNITGNATLEHNISLIPAIDIVNKTIVSTGKIRGYVFENGSLQPINNATISVAGIYAYSNSSGYYGMDVREGVHNLVAIKSGYNIYYTNITVLENNISYHNITMTVYAQPGLGAGQGAGQGPGLGAGQGAGLGAGLGAGKGPGTGVPRIEQPVEIVEFEVSVKKIIKKLRQGNFIKVPIQIKNHRESTANLKLTVEGEVAEMARLDKGMLVMGGKSADEVIMTLLGNVEPGIYEGNFVVSGDYEEKIPIYVLVMEKERLDIEALVIKVTPEKKKVSAGSTFKYRVDLQNMLSEEKYKVDLRYYINGIDSNETIFLEKEEVVILTSFSLLKKADLPVELKAGDYQLKLIANYLGYTTEQATIFTVVEPFYRYRLFGLIPVWLLLIFLAVVLAAAFGLMYYRKRKAEQQRYRIEVDYNQLPGPGPRAAYVGLLAETNKKTYFDLEQLTIHTLVAGSTGGGKTVAAQGIIEEALKKGTAVIVFDPTVQWTGFLRKCQDKKFLELYPRFGLKKADSKAFDGNIHQVENARQAIDFKKFMKPGEINVFVVNKLDVKDYEIFVSNVIRSIFHSNLPEARQLKLIIIFDEFHRLLPKYGGTGEVMIQVERATREFRKWGVGMMLISQVISDFRAEVLANINTQIQMRTKDEGDLSRIKEEYGENLLKSLVKAAVGAGMVENASYNKGKPYFVQFRPLLHSTVRLSDEELESYNKYNTLIDGMDYQLEQLEQENIDVFDLRLELKLAQDKVKSGSFNMVDIYLEGLKPRIEAQWEKIGKQPKARELNLISEEDLRKEIEKAKEAKNSENTNPPKTKEPIKGETVAKPVDKSQGESQKGVIIRLVSEIFKTMGSDSKKTMELYARLQSMYKAASPDNKRTILAKSTEIREKWSKK